MKLHMLRGEITTPDNKTQTKKSRAAPDNAQAHDLQRRAVGTVQAQAEKLRQKLQVGDQGIHGFAAHAEQARQQLGHGHAVRSHRRLRQLLYSDDAVAAGLGTMPFVLQEGGKGKPL